VYVCARRIFFSPTTKEPAPSYIYKLRLLDSLKNQASLCDRDSAFLTPQLIRAHAPSDFVGPHACMHACNHNLRLFVYAFVYMGPKACARASTSYAMHVMLMRARCALARRLTSPWPASSDARVHLRSWQLKASVFADIHAYSLPHPT